MWVNQKCTSYLKRRPWCITTNFLKKAWDFSKFYLIFGIFPLAKYLKSDQILILIEEITSSKVILIVPNIIPVEYFQQEQKDRDRQDQEAALEEARNKVLDCPLCGKKLKTTNVSSVNPGCYEFILQSIRYI